MVNGFTWFKQPIVVKENTSPMESRKLEEKLEISGEINNGVMRLKIKGKEISITRNELEREAGSDLEHATKEGIKQNLESLIRKGFGMKR
jgi:hypothetical protein